MTIEAALYSGWPSGSIGDQLYHRSFEGYCENIPQGAVRVELWVGRCSSGNAQGDSYTGWRSVSRIIYFILFIYYFPTIKITQALHYTKMWRGDLRKPQGLYEEAPSLQ